jgi:dephospho-CoA kinase
MLKIGVTGGIGSGKSIVCEMFQLLGVPVYNADEQAKKLVNSDPQIIDTLTKKYGQDIYNKGVIDKKRLAGIIFNNKVELKFVNETIHPRVFAHFDEWLELNNDDAYIIKEAALLFESGSYKDLDKIILVTAPEEIRIKRVVERDQTNEVEVKRIIESQMSENEKQKKSNYIINNDNTVLIIPYILEMHNEFTNAKT